MIEHCYGDLFTSMQPVLGHGVNCAGTMAGGVARQFRKRYPEMYKEYRLLCWNGGLVEGGVFPYQADDGRTILNIVVQFLPGPFVKDGMVHNGIESAYHYCLANNMPGFAIPEIGFGSGKMAWHDVEKTIEEVSAKYPSIDLEIWHHHNPAEKKPLRPVPVTMF